MNPQQTFPETHTSARATVTAAHALSAADTIQEIGSDPRRGLSAAQVEKRRQEHGENELPQAPPAPLWKKFLAQFADLIIGILIAAAVISGVLGDWPDTAAILAIVILNGVLGFLQEERAERALAALEKLSAPQATVVRAGRQQLVPARELVPGDRIELEAGASIPADARLIEAFGLRVQEAALTGESVPIEKTAHVVLSRTTPLAERRNMVYMGTVVAAGKASAVVVATGLSTQLGQIAGMLQRHQPEPTPLQRRLAELGRVLIVVCLVIVGIIFGLQILRGGEWVEMFLLAVSLAVAAVPEGLPAVVTISLALGLQRMVRRNALIRRLPSVETLGAVTVICSDKTGTLTRNEMTVREVLVGNRWYRVTGAGYDPHGEFLKHRQGVDDHFEELGSEPELARSSDTSVVFEPVDPQTDPDLVQALTIAARCHHASVVPPGRDAETWQVVGDPTEGALLVAALKARIEAAAQPAPLLHEIPFDSERKAMSVVVSEASGKAVMYTKGATEVILSKCVAERRDGSVHPLSKDRQQQILQASAAMAGRALRVLALAYREIPDQDPEAISEAELIFAGLVGMIDPPREEAKAAVGKCRQAGIRPVMITGDHPATAVAIARELEMLSEGGKVVSGEELDGMSDDGLSAQVEQIAVYARVSAEHKLRVVQAWKSRGQVVAMTGDGVNDAPALKSADIGIAMGRTGTDVTKEASDMVLTDDNFASIVAAVEEGRGIYDNIQKFVHYLLSCNAGEVLLMFFAALVGWPAPLRAIQILWINLVTDGLPALALGMEPPERDLMHRPPRPPKEPVITPKGGSLMVLHGVLIAAVTAVGFALVYYEVIPTDGQPVAGVASEGQTLDRARTVAFCTIAFAQLFFSLSCRSARYTMPQLGLLTNPRLFAAIAISAVLQLGVVIMPWARPVFEVSAPLGWEWGVVLLLALTPVTLIEVAKLVRASLARVGESGR